MIEEVIEYFKSVELPEHIVPLLEDKGMQKLLSVWQNVKITRRKSKKEVPENNHEKWNWLWEQHKIDVESVRAMLGASEARIQNELRQVISLRLVYPDGSINEYARKYLHARVLKEFSKQKIK